MLLLLKEKKRERERESERKRRGEKRKIDSIFLSLLWFVVSNATNKRIRRKKERGRLIRKKTRERERESGRAQNEL